MLSGPSDCLDRLLTMMMMIMIIVVVDDGDDSSDDEGWYEACLLDTETCANPMLALCSTN